MVRVAVCLSGCGVKDGSEIHEATSTLIALDQEGAKAVCCAPEKRQTQVINHVKGEPVEGDQRCVIVESARISRGEISPLPKIHANDIDALILPGGLGAAINLSTFAAEGADCDVDSEVERLVNEMVEAGKPVGAICIAPALLSRILGRRGSKASVTIGNDPDVASAVERMGMIHQDCSATDVVVDEENKIVTTPAYMLAEGPAEVFEGISKLVKEVIRLSR